MAIFYDSHGLGAAVQPGPSRCTTNLKICTSLLFNCCTVACAQWLRSDKKQIVKLCHRRLLNKRLWTSVATSTNTHGFHGSLTDGQQTRGKKTSSLPFFAVLNLEVFQASEPSCSPYTSRGGRINDHHRGELVNPKHFIIIKPI